MKSIISILSIFTYSICFGQSEWRFVDSSAENVEYFVKDLQTTNESSVYAFWVKAQYPDKKAKNKKGQLITLPGKSSVGSWEIHCAQKAYKIYRVIVYNGKGSIISDDSQNPEWGKIVPDTIAEAVFEFVCVKQD